MKSRPEADPFGHEEEAEEKRNPFVSIVMPLRSTKGPSSRTARSSCAIKGCLSKINMNGNSSSMTAVGMKRVSWQRRLPRRAFPAGQRNLQEYPAIGSPHPKASCNMRANGPQSVLQCLIA